MEEKHSIGELGDDMEPPVKRPALEPIPGAPPDVNATYLTGPKAILRHYQPILAKLINLNSLIPHLNHYQLLTDRENEELQNEVNVHSVRVQKLLHFVERKGDKGFQLFLNAIAEEHEHLGHKELTEMFAPFRHPVDMPSVSSSLHKSKPAISVPQSLLHLYQPKLMTCIDLDSLIPHLNKQQILTDYENELLLNQNWSHQRRLLYLLEFIERKENIGLLRFLEAIASEKSHLGHLELDETLAPFRLELTNTLKDPLKSVVNNSVLQAALNPITGAEFDLQESIIEDSSPSNVESIQRKEMHTMIELSTSSGNTSRIYKKQLSENVESFSSIEASNEDTISIISVEEGSASSSLEDSQDSSCDEELDKVKKFLLNEETEEPFKRILQKYPKLTYPSGPLKKKSNSMIYTSLFKMAWNGKEDTARHVMKYLRRREEVSVDIKIVAMEVVHTVNAERDLKILTSALAYTDRSSCENKSILKCRLHRRIAGLHYRNLDLEEANEHMDTALQLAHNIAPDIDSIYTYRLKGLMLFEDFKKTGDKKYYREANKFFTKAMDHARQQPESKRIVTERVKVSKALFHLDMRSECVRENKEEDYLKELEYRTEDTLEDVDEDFLTDADRAFFYMTKAKLCVCNQDWQTAQEEAQKALTLNTQCGLSERAKQAQEILDHIPSGNINGTL